MSFNKAIELSRQAKARRHNREYVRDNTTATNKSVDYVKPAHTMNKHKAGAKPKATTIQQLILLPQHILRMPVVRPQSTRWAPLPFEGGNLSKLSERGDIFTLCVVVNKFYSVLTKCNS